MRVDDGQVDAWRIAGCAIFEKHRQIRLLRRAGDPQAGKLDRRPDQIPRARGVGGKPDARPVCAKGAAFQLHLEIEVQPGEKLADHPGLDRHARAGLADMQDHAVQFKIPPPRAGRHQTRSC
jgi:hypothetical protein